MAFETRELRAELRAERARLSELARTLSWTTPAEGARLVGEVVATAIAQGALESMTMGLDDDGPLTLAADGARLRALDALARTTNEPAQSVIEAQRRSIAERHPEAVEEAEALAEVSLDENTRREALAARLAGPDLDAAVAEPTGWPTAALVERLAALGRVAEVPPFVERWAGGGWYSAHALLRAGALAPEELGPSAREALGALDSETRADLCGRYPAAAVRVLGPETVLRLADEAGDETGQYVRIVALARVTAALPEQQRSEAAARALRAYREDPDPDALEELVKCAPWMPVDEAALLFVDHVGQHATPRSFENAFAGFAGIASFAPLIARAAGDPGLLAAADAVVAAEAWQRSPAATSPART